MINELLEKRDHLMDIAAILYGDMYVCNDKFWGSPTEQDMLNVELALESLGYDSSANCSEEIKQAATKIMSDLIDKGIL